MDKKQTNKVTITTNDGLPFQIPVEGSLGLLALGYKGLVAWRQVRRQYQKTVVANKAQKQENKPDTKS